MRRLEMGLVVAGLGLGWLLSGSAMAGREPTWVKIDPEALSWQSADAGCQNFADVQLAVDKSTDRCSQAHSAIARERCASHPRVTDAHRHIRFYRACMGQHGWLQR